MSVFMLNVVVSSTGLVTIIEEVTWNKSSLILKIQKQNTQTLQ